jgi:hypothetical protein
MDASARVAQARQNILFRRMETDKNIPQLCILDSSHLDLRSSETAPNDNHGNIRRNNRARLYLFRRFRLPLILRILLKGEWG